MGLVFLAIILSCVALGCFIVDKLAERHDRIEQEYQDWLEAEEERERQEEAEENSGPGPQKKY